MKRIKIALGVLAVLIVVPVLALAIAGASPNSNRIAAPVIIPWVSWLVEVRDQGAGEPAAGQSAVWVMEDRNNGNARMAPLVCWQAKKKMRGDLEQLRLEGGL